MVQMKVHFFASPDEFRSWLKNNHATQSELWVGYYKKSTGKPAMTWSQSVDVALCFGWIDGIRKTIDAESYKIRFTPRKPGSNWSAVNLKKIETLKKMGLLRAAGVKAFEERKPKKTGYSYEDRKTIVLEPSLEKKFRANKKAWTFFQQQPPSYRSTILFWIMSAKQPETRERRLQRLIQVSANLKRLL